MACDVSNLWKSCRDQYGLDSRLDFQILSRLLPAKRHPRAVDMCQVAYLVTNAKQKHHAFYSALRGYGYTIRERVMRFDKSKGKPTRTDWDVGITIDALDLVDEYDTFALASGDGDFTQLLRYLKLRGKNTVVVTFDCALSKSLYKVADEVIILGKDSVFS